MTDMEDNDMTPIVKIVYGSGAFEQSFDDLGYVVTPQDIENFYSKDLEFDLWNWLVNVFYNTSGINKLFPDATVEAIVKRLIEIKADDEEWGIYIYNRIPLAKKMQKLFNAAGMEEALRDTSKSLKK